MLNFRRYIFRDLVYLPVVHWQAGDLIPHLDFLDKSGYWSGDRIQELQQQRLRRLLGHAVRSVPRYREIIGDESTAANFDLVDLKSLPFMTKHDIQQHPDSHRSIEHVSRLIVKTTGGSTGQPVTIWKTRTSWCQELAATWRGYRWAGINIGDPQARFWGVPFSAMGRAKAQIIDLLCNRLRLSAFGFNDRSMRRYVKQLKLFRPSYFYGYVSMIAEFAEYLDREVADWRPDLKCVITTSEVLTEPVRCRIRDVIGAPVFNEYGCGEVGTIAHECSHGRMHLSAENMYVEILDGDRVCDFGENGEIVVTELNNTAMPLVRYRLGDYGRMDSTSCPCGLTLPVLAGIHGRAYDMVRNRQGAVFHGEYIMYIFEDIKSRGKGIRQFQFLQEELARFRVRIVPGESYGKDTRDIIRKRIRESIDPHAEVTFEVVESIDREASGKLRLIVGLGSRTAG